MDCDRKKTTGTTQLHPSLQFLCLSDTIVTPSTAAARPHGCSRLSPGMLRRHVCKMGRSPDRPNSVCCEQGTR